MKKLRKNSTTKRQFTKRKRTEEALRENEEKYRMIFENSPLGIFRSTFKGRLLEVNVAFAKMFGYNSPETMVREIHDVGKQLYLRGEDRNRIVSDQMSAADVTHHLNRYRRKDGKQFVANLYLKTVRDAHGRPLLLEGILEDITERKRLEERLRSLHRYARRLASAKDLDEMVNHTLDTIQFNLGFDSAEFDLIEDGLLVVKGNRGKMGPSLSRTIEDLGVIPKAARELRSIRVDDTRKEPNYVDRMGPGWKGTRTMLSELATPVVVDGRAVAVLNVEHTQLEAFSEQDQILLQNLAAHVASEIKRKRVEEGLRQSEERYSSLFDRMQDGVYLSTHEGRFVDINSAFVKMFGYSSKQEMLDLKDIKKALYFSPEERGSHILDTGREEAEVYRMRRKDGSEIWVEDHGRYIHDEHGKVLYHEGILRDVTERKRAEEALANERNVLRTLMDNLPDNIFIKDVESRFVMSNLAHAYLLRAKTPDEIVGKTDFDIFPRELAASYYADEQTVIQSGQPLLNREERTLDPEGKTRWLLTTKVPLRDDHGKVIGIAGINRDITERKRMEDEIKRYSEHLEELVEERTRSLAESEARYRRLFESSPISFWEEDFSEVKRYFDGLRARGIQDIRRYFIEHPEDLAKCASMVQVLDVNEVTLELYGAKSVGELRGELRRVLTSDFYDNFREELAALSEGKTRFESEFDNQTMTGGTKHVNLILNVVPGYEDTLAKVLVSIIDLTERKEMEERLQQAERLAAVGETAAMVGHDLRNPLQGITGAVHLLKQEPLTAKEREEMLQVIEKSLRYSDAIIRDLSDYSAEIKLRLAEATPKSIARDALGAVKVPQNVIVQDFSEDEPRLRIDPERMRRVFINLIENAIDAMPQGGILTVSSKRSFNGIEMAISDSGLGMPERAIGNLFKPLQTTKAKGMGLGLAICKRVVDAHGGNISVRSKAGEGTTVSIVLPIRLISVEVRQK